MGRHPVVRAGLALIAFRAAGLTHRYILQPDVSIGRRLALFLPALASHVGVLTAIVAAFLLACAAAPRWRRAISIAACATFAGLMIAGQADLTVSSITGAPLTPTVFRTFRGLQVVTSNEFLEPLRANWPVTAIGILAFAALTFWMMRAASTDGPRAAPSPAPTRSALLVAGGLVAAWITAFAPWAIPPPPIEAAFALEYLGLDHTSLDVPEPEAIADLRALVGLPPGAEWVSPQYPLAYAPAHSPPSPRPRPDIVVVMVESLRAEELSVITGREESVTPNLDALAARSAVFTSYLSNAFPSAPSVLSFHASAWPHRRKEIITDFSGTQFDSLPGRLRGLGYDTIYVGADPHFDNQDRWLRRWYAGVSDLVASGSEATDRNIVSRAMAEIRRHDAVAAANPLFLFVSTYSTHYPFRLPSDAGEQEAPERAGLGTRYRQVLHYTDRQIGALLDMLAARTRQAQTATIVVGDHSFYTNLRKTSGLPENDNEWTALIVNGGGSTGPQRIAEPASHVDILPTILAMVGDDRPTAAVGTDLFGPPRSAPRRTLAVRPGGVRLECGGYSVFVDARSPNGAEIRPSFQARPGAVDRAMPTAAQVTEWVNTWSYLVERDRVWNPELLRKSSRGAGQ
ncbi:MAG TPA: sulfatase-like hydrolase/transferase [Vicinamibacterales bacterium]|nr:sulfatase-like hydrolase/transferase [Vicinamibacterales bacterium]